MAERRMFAKSIVLSDAFLDMPMSARCLYFTLNMFADDDGFVGSPKGIMRQCGASQDDMAILLQKRFLIGFESGVVVIKHWLINNYLQNDRKKQTTYLEELAMLSKDKKNAYIEAQNIEDDTNVSKMYTQVSLVEDRIVKDSVVKFNCYGEFKNVQLSESEYETIKQKYPNHYSVLVDSLSKYMNEKNKSYKNCFKILCDWGERDYPSDGKQKSYDIKKVGKRTVLDLMEGDEDE